MIPGDSDERNIERHASLLAGKAGLQGSVRLKPIVSGRNNRVYQMLTDEDSYLLKFYFRHENDRRDRLGTEFCFISFAWKQGLRVVPRPLAIDRSNSIGLYEFVQGRKLSPEEVTGDTVQQALDFYRALNGNKDDPEAKRLPPASESCFSIADHISCISSRLQRLGRIEGDDTTTREAGKFIHNELIPAWKRAVDKARRRADESGLELDRHILPEDRRLSPSDFGFHNTILESHGGLRFIDFEYAGWDDPAKTVCDFFCQPEVPVPMRYMPMFQNAAACGLSSPDILQEKIMLLFPLYHLKWCCIILNDFLPEGSERRQFADKRDRNEIRTKQLTKARAYFQDYQRADYP